MALATRAEGSAEKDIIGKLGDFVLGLSVNNSDESSVHGTENKGKEVMDQPPMVIEIRKLFVASLDKRVSKDNLEDLFGAFGAVQNAHFARKPNGTKQSFGFVTFYDPEDAERALAAGRQGLKLMGRPLIIKKAELQHQPKRLANGRIQWHRRRLASNRLNSPALIPRPVEEIDETKCFVQQLNDDCLMHIFSFLGNRELIKIESVCKHWQSLSKQMWRSIKQLDFDWLPSSSSSSTPTTLTTHILHQMVARCGPNVQSLDVSHSPSELKESALCIIAEKCPNLQCLNLSNLSYLCNLKPLYKVTNNLQRLVLNNCCNQTDDKSLGDFFRHCPNLTSLSVTENPNLNGACLANLSPDKLVELVVDNCYGMHDRTVVESFSRLKSLKRLSMNGCLYLNNAIAEEIFKTVRQLEAISLSHRFPLLQGIGLASLSILTELTSLTLHLNAAVNDEVLRAVSRGCKKLQHLDISGCSVLGYLVDQTVTDVGIEFVAQLPQLTHLKMSYMAVFSDQSLRSLAEKGRLKSLECRGCPTITDFGCERVISLCNELERFDLSGVNFLTKLTIETANNAVKLRTNNVKLTLIVGGTECCSEDDVLNNLDPLLEIDFSNLCVDHHRPDFIDNVYFMPGEEDDDTDDDFDLDDDDEIGDFDLECQAMFVGDDLADFFKFQAAHGFLDSDSDFDDDDLNFMAGPFFPG